MSLNAGDDFVGDYCGSQNSGRRVGDKRPIGDLVEEEGNGFSSKKGKSLSEESGPGAATGMILSLRESLQNCKDTLAACQSELEATRSEIQKWDFAFQNGPITPAGTLPVEPRLVVTYLQTLKSSEESLKEQLEKAKKREAALIVTFAKREQEIADLKSAVQDLKTQLRPPSMQTRRLLLDPAIHDEFTRLKNLVEEKDKQVKELQDNIDAVKFNVHSKMGQKLMDRCRTLQDYNVEIGTRTSEGKIHELVMKISALKSQNGELRNQFDVLYKDMEGLESDADRSNEMVYILQGKLDAKDDELRTLKEMMSRKKEEERNKINVDAMNADYESNPKEAEARAIPTEADVCADPTEADVCANPLEADSSFNPTEADVCANSTKPDTCANPMEADTCANPTEADMCPNPAVADA